VAAVDSVKGLVGVPQDWDAALEELLKLKELVDANTFMPMLQQLQQRTWLMHWGLFVFFNHENGRNLIIDNLFQDRCELHSFPQEATCLCDPALIGGHADCTQVQHCTWILQ
jgi:hypothetical protein